MFTFCEIQNNPNITSFEMLEIVDSDRGTKFSNDYCYPDISQNYFDNDNSYNNNFQYNEDSIMSLSSFKFLPSYQTTNICLLKAKFGTVRRKYNNKAGTLRIDESSLEKTFEKLNSLVSEFNFTDCHIELTQSKSIKFSLSFPGNILLMLSSFFDSDDIQADEVVYTIFVNRQLIVSNVAEIQSFTEKFRDIL